MNTKSILSYLLIIMIIIKQPSPQTNLISDSNAEQSPAKHIVL